MASRGGWVTLANEEGMAYYWHVESGETTWDAPWDRERVQEGPKVSGRE
jgi:hypothetical protein